MTKFFRCTKMRIESCRYSKNPDIQSREETWGVDWAVKGFNEKYQIYFFSTLM